MDKATRILNILTLLLNGHVVTQKDLNFFTNVSKKSIQRDINTLNTFFYESDFWRNNHTKVVYNHQLGGYEMTQDTKNKQSLGVLSLLIKLQSLTPILHYDIYKFFLNAMSSVRIEDKHILMTMLNQFKVRDDLLPGKILMDLQKAIVNKYRVRIEVEHDKMTVKPLSILYMHYDYWFTYEFQRKIHTVSLKSIQSIQVLDRKYSKDHANNAVLFEISTKIWNQLKKQFSIKDIVSRNNDAILVWVNCTRFDAYYIAYQLAPLAKIIAPEAYIDSFIHRLDEIKRTYTKENRTEFILNSSSYSSNED